MEQSITKSKELFNFMLDEFYDLVDTGYFYDHTPHVLTQTRIKFKTDLCKLVIRYIDDIVLGVMISMPVSIGDSCYKWLLNKSGDLVFSQLLSTIPNDDTNYLPIVSANADHMLITSSWKKMQFPIDSTFTGRLTEVVSGLLKKYRNK